MKKELLESKDFRDFVSELQTIFSQYVAGVQQVVVDNIEKSFNNDAIRLLVKDYAEELRRVKRWNNTTLMDALEDDGKVHIEDVSVLRDYGQAIYTLCYKRYVKESE